MEELGLTYEILKEINVGNPAKVRRPAPLPGQHNSYVFGELLGTSYEIQSLEEQVIY